MRVFAFPVQCVSFQSPHTAALTKPDKEVSERITKSSFIQRIYKNNSPRLKGGEKKEELKKQNISSLAGKPSS